MELLPWLTAIGRLQDAAMLFAFVVFLITPKAGRKNFLTIGIILSVGFLVEICSWTAWAVFHRNPNAINLIHDYFIVPAFFFFYKPKITSKKIINLFIVLVITYLAFAILNTIFYQDVMRLPTYTLAMQCVVLMAFSTIFFLQLSKELPRPVYVRLPVFWINNAVLVYYSVLLPIYLVTDYIYITLKLSIIPLWMVHNGVGVVYYVFLAMGLWHNRALYTPQSSLRD
jgi:hypothetical protein